MALKEQVKRSNLGSVSFNNGDYTSGACNLFGEMSESKWRSPSHVLEVTIHRAYYPITEEVLHLVFDPFGEVEHVHVLGGSDHLLAQVVFKTKHAAAEAFEELQGQCVYTGCCQLDIKWGLSQDSGASMEKGCPNTIASMTSESDISGITSASSDTMANASPVRSASAATAMSTLNGDISSAMLPMEATATETHRTTCAIAASYDSDDVAVQPVTALDAMVVASLRSSKCRWHQHRSKHQWHPPSLRRS
ncbi:unnamed protein product [Urochloa decumbens]|uniref:PTBP1-like RNA recognition motif 2 domain-containing protein n=1 Tax=Urochloa decumbens TaxID=240449 RepID=A0ABC8ZZR7_9POAL